MINPTTGRYFYRVETRSFATRWFHWIDAANGQVLKKYDGIANNDANGVKGDTKSVNGLTPPPRNIWARGVGGHYDLFSTDGRKKTYDYRNRGPNIYYVTDGNSHWTRVTNNRRSPGHPALIDAQYYADVTDCSSGLIYLNESTALNESFSDILGNRAEFYAQDNGLDPTVSADWLVGEDIYLPADSAAGDRNMADPEEDGDPDHYSERQVGGGDNGGVHTNSGIPNHAYYLLVNGGLSASCAILGTHNSAHCTGSETPVAGIGSTAAEQIFFLAFFGL